MTVKKGIEYRWIGKRGEKPVILETIQGTGWRLSKNGNWYKVRTKNKVIARGLVIALDNQPLFEVTGRVDLELDCAARPKQSRWKMWIIWKLVG